MNLSTKQTHRHKEQTYQEGGGQGRERLKVWDQQMQNIIYIVDKQQGPTVQHKELYSISCDKPSWERI